MAYKVFISSALKDFDLERDLVNRLEHAGIEVLSHDKKPAAEKISSRVTKALSGADEIFVILSAESIENPNLMFELGAASSLRQNIGTPLTPAEQAKLEAGLHPARQALPNTIGVTSWLEGWAWPIEKAIKEVLVPEAASSSC